MKEFLDSEIFLYILKPIIYIAVAYIIYRILNFILQQALIKNNVSSKHRRKLETSKSIIVNFVKYLIIIITMLSILSLYHVDVSKIFAGIGIATAVLSLAFQDVAKDFLARPDVKQNLRETVHLACGIEMQIKFVDTKEATKTSSNEFEQFIENNDIPFNII